MTVAPSALDLLDDALTLSPADRDVADVFERHLQWATTGLDQRLYPLPADVCACGGPKEPAEPECNSCFLDWDDAMRRAEDI